MKLHDLKEDREGFTLYNAGLPHYPRNFTRDSILSSFLLEDADMLLAQLKFCALKQGASKNPQTGEEPGKIFHEYPEFSMRDLSTMYNACDATALFLMGLERYLAWTGDRELISELHSNIEAAVKYIQTHVESSLFWEDPKYCGADKFALRVTYWKDSVLLDRPDGEPSFPVVFTMAHIQNMCGLKSAARLLGSSELESEASAMCDALSNLIDPDSSLFFLALDSKGPVRGVTTDLLHSLYYLEREDVSDSLVSAIVKASEVLETDAGYRTMAPEDSERMQSGYHSKTVWPFEQAFIHSAAIKFGLARAADVTRRVVDYLDTDAEILVLRDNKIEKGGCDPQLWTIAAKHYLLEQQ